MTASRIRADYDQLAGIRKNFSSEAEATQRTLQDLRSRLQTLEGGDWVGRGAKAFYGEMNDSVLPSLTRLQRALTQAAAVTDRLEKRIRQAEADAAQRPTQRACLTDAAWRRAIPRAAVAGRLQAASQTPVAVARMDRVAAVVGQVRVDQVLKPPSQNGNKTTRCWRAIRRACSRTTTCGA